MQEFTIVNQPGSIPRLVVETAEDAMSIVNRWLHAEVGMALNADTAEFSPQTFCWHLPINLAYGSTGRLGVVGDIYLHAGTGEFTGAPTILELRNRAEELADVRGIAE